MNQAGQIGSLIILGLLIAEAASRFVVGNNAMLARLIGPGDPIGDTSWRLQWVRNSSDNAPFELSFDMYDPLLGWRTKPGIQGGLTGRAKLTTNTKGIRSLKEYPYDKPPNTTRIVLLGDSFTFGENVADEQTYAYLLEQTLENVEVINFGVHGWGHDQMLLSLEEEGVKYAPDIVLLGFIYDDSERNTLSFRDFAKPVYRIEEGKLTLTNVPVPSPAEVLRRERYHLRIVDVATMLYDNFLSKSGKKTPEAEAVTAAILQELIRATKQIGALPIFVYLPTARESVDLSAQTPGERFFSGFCKTADILCENLRPLFTYARVQGKTLTPIGHWDAAGHELVAQGIRQLLADRVFKE